MIYSEESDSRLGKKAPNYMPEQSKKIGHQTKNARFGRQSHCKRKKNLGSLSDRDSESQISTWKTIYETCLQY